MNAEQAKRKSKEVNATKHENHYLAILKEINKACDNGNTEATYYKEPTKETKQVLANDGFELSEHWDNRNEYQLTIRW